MYESDLTVAWNHYETTQKTLHWARHALHGANTIIWADVTVTNQLVSSPHVAVRFPDTCSLASDPPCHRSSAGKSFLRAYETLHRGVANFRTTFGIVPSPCSYSRRICSNSSTFALQSTAASILGFAHDRVVGSSFQARRNQIIKSGQSRVAKSVFSTNTVKVRYSSTFGTPFIRFSYGLW